MLRPDDHLVVKLAQTKSLSRASRRIIIRLRLGQVATSIAFGESGQQMLLLLKAHRSRVAVLQKDQRLAIEKGLFRPYLSAYPRERAGMLLLDSALARHRVLVVGSEDVDESIAYLKMALASMRKCEPLIQKPSRHSRLEVNPFSVLALPHSIRSDSNRRTTSIILRHDAAWPFSDRWIKDLEHSPFSLFPIKTRMAACLQKRCRQILSPMAWFNLAR